jgi:hypothetical protein
MLFIKNKIANVCYNPVNEDVTTSKVVKTTKRKKKWLLNTFGHSIGDEAVLQLTEHFYFNFILISNVLCSIVENILMGTESKLQTQLIVFIIATCLFLITQILIIVKIHRKLLKPVVHLSLKDYFSQPFHLNKIQYQVNGNDKPFILSNEIPNEIPNEIRNEIPNEMRNEIPNEIHNEIPNEKTNKRPNETQLGIKDEDVDIEKNVVVFKTRPYLPLSNKLFQYCCQKIPYFKAVYYSILPETWIELSTILIGWILFFIPSTFGLASIRGLRIFRYVWYCKYFITDVHNKKSLFSFLIFYGHVILQYFENVRKEIFTRETKGAVAIFIIFYYLAFIFSIIIKTSIGPETQLEYCDTQAHCFFTMLRISFYDGNGFDFIAHLMDSGHEFLASLLFCYLCISSIILINGLIGIFGSAFSNIASELSSSDNSSPYYRNSP